MPAKTGPCPAREAPQARLRSRRGRVLSLVSVLTACTCNHGTATDPRAPSPEPVDDPDTAPMSSAPRDAYTHEADPALAERIKRQFGGHCRFKVGCGELVVVDCGAVADGPLYFVRRDTLDIVLDCGGRCVADSCTECPPESWTTCVRAHRANEDPK